MKLSEQLGRVAKLIKESAETGLFSIFTKRQTTEAFTGGPLHFVLFPLVAVSLSLNLIVESIRYKKALNKSVFNTVTLGLVSLLTGLALSSILGTLILGEFALGPLLFVGALATGVVLQMTQFFHNLFHALRMPKGLGVRKALLQAAASNVFNTVLLGLTIALVTAVMISPAGPAVLMGLGVATATLTAASLIWTLMPHQWKNNIKRFFGFGKKKYDGIERSERAELETLRSPVLAQYDTTNAPLLNSSQRFTLLQPEKHKLALVNIAKRNVIEAKNVLVQALKDSMERLAPKSNQHYSINNTSGARQAFYIVVNGEFTPIKEEDITKHKDVYIRCNRGVERQYKKVSSQYKKVSSQLNKQGQKIELLKGLMRALNKNEIPETLKVLHTQYPLAFQSFLQTTSHTEHLYHLVKFFIDNYRSETISAELAANIDEVFYTHDEETAREIISNS